MLDFLKSERAVGVSIAIAHQKGSTYAAAGFADRESQRAVKPETLFRLASISKTVTATCTMQLVEKKKLDLNVGISKYVNGFDDRDGAITLAKVLGHTSGIRHYLDGKDDASFAPTTTEQAIAKITNDALLFKPGEKYSYSTHAFAIPVAAIEKVSGMTYRDYLRANISLVAAPSLDCEVSAEDKPLRTSLYTKTDAEAKLETKREDISWKVGGGGLESTAADLAKYGLAVSTGKLLGKEARATMWTKQTLNNGKRTGYGLGWDLGVDGLARHGGGQQGCSSYLLVDYKRNISVAVLCNTGGVDAAKLADKLYKLWLERGGKSYAYLH